MKKFSKSSVAVVIALVVSFMPGFTGPISALAAGPAVVDLGAAGNYTILAKTAITTTGVTSITGDIGVSPAAATTITGFSLVLDGSGTFSTSALVTGRVYAANYAAPTPATLTTAVLNMQAAYTDASGRTPGVGATNLNVGAGTLSGNNFVPGTYTWDTPGNVDITGDITLTGTATDIWILQITGTLTLQDNKKINLAGGALPQNVFWAVAGTTTVKPGATFSGVILGGPGASTIAFQSGSTLNGRALGQTDVTLIATTISDPIVTSIPGVFAGSGYAGLGNYLVPVIGIMKVPTPLALPAGAGLVTYNYTVWNVGGQRPLTNINVTDDKCSQIAFVSGDLNGNNKLDPGEYWKYKCSTTVSQTTTNTAVATGYSDSIYHQAAIANAIATVVVGSPTTPPLINVVKIPSQLTPFPFGGGNVTYSYIVTNPGVVAMSDVTLTDDKCAPVSRTSGDVNSNNLLDPGESWVYACRTKVSISTKNTAMVSGKANGFTALGQAFATVLVALPISSGAPTPSFPNTGFPPEEKDNLQSIAILGILALVSASIVITLKKRAINNQR